MLHQINLKLSLINFFKLISPHCNLQFLLFNLSLLVFTFFVEEFQLLFNDLRTLVPSISGHCTIVFTLNSINFNVKFDILFLFRTFFCTFVLLGTMLAVIKFTVFIFNLIWTYLSCLHPFILLIYIFFILWQSLISFHLHLLNDNFFSI